MGVGNSTDREQKKRQLKRRIVESGPAPFKQKYQEDEDEEEIVRRAERTVRFRRGRLFLILSCILLVAVFSGYQYVTGHKYTSYTVAWEKTIPASEGSFTGYENFGDNLLKYTKDGATYIDKSGKPVWSLSFQMKSPICYVNGDFAAIADQQGNTIIICDKTGLRGQAATLLPILRVSVSAHGVAAALVEDSVASYVTFYKVDGSTLDWGIKTVMAKNGYLLDLSLSPDGTQVMLSVVYLHEGSLKNRIVFYNFSEFGKTYPDRLVGGFDEFADNLAPRVRILDEGHACVFSDGKIGFFSLENVTSPEMVKLVDVEAEIRSIAYSDKYVGVVESTVSGENPYRMDIYKANGELAFAEEFNYPYQSFDIDGEFVFLYNENSCRIYSTTGKERFSGEFDFTVAKITKGSGFNSFIVTGGDTIREIKLK